MSKAVVKFFNRTFWTKIDLLCLLLGILLLIWLLFPNIIEYINLETDEKTIIEKIHD